MSRGTTRATVAVTLLLLVLATGCGPTAAPGSAPGPSTTSSTGHTATDPVLHNPLQAYRLTVTELTTVGQARSILISRCMARLGFDVPVESFEERLRQNRYGELAALGRLYGITDRETAAARGYGTPPEPRTVKPPRTASQAELVALKGRTAPGTSPDPDTDGATTGIPAGGCVGEAEREFEKDPDISNYGLGHTLWIEAMNRLQGSSGYRQIIGDWSRCLAELGYAVTSPLNDEGDIKRLSATGSAQGKASPAEIKLALADIDCKDEVDLVGRLDRAGSAIADALIEQHQEALKEDRERLDRQIHRATALVKESS